MKTTIDISDALFASSKTLAQQRQTTLRALIEDGLRRVLRDAKANPGRGPGGRRGLTRFGDVFADGAVWGLEVEDAVAVCTNKNGANLFELCRFCVV